MENVLDLILLVIIMSWVAILAYAIGIIKTLYSIGAFSTHKETKSKNNVHFYVARDKISNVLWLYIGKPTKCNYSERWIGSEYSKSICMEYNFKDVGLDKNDYKDLKWEDEPVEVFLNLK